MERYKKTVFCTILNKEVNVTYFYENVKGRDGLIKTKSVEFYNCDGRKECSDSYDMLNCSCFKDMLKVEHDINTH
jgi:hypothetical protein